MSAHVVSVATAGRIAAGDGAVGAAHNAGAAVGHHDEDAVAVVPAAHTLHALIGCRIAQPPVNTYGSKAFTACCKPCYSR